MYTRNELKDAIQNNYSIASTLRSLGIKPSTQDYRDFRRKIELWNLDITHFDPYKQYSLRKPRPMQSLEKILVLNNPNDIYIKSYSLKIKLFKEGMKSRKCERCGIEDWFGFFNHLQLDHINGLNWDNRIENLRILCANCHSLTDTYTGKKLTKSSQEPKRCAECLEPLRTRKATFCRYCANFIRNNTKIIWPPLIELIEEVQNSSYLAASRRLGISDNAIRKHIESRLAQKERKLRNLINISALDENRTH